MPDVLDTLLLNALVACGLAAVVAALARWVRRPALLHCLWVLVLLKLVVPAPVPVAVLPVPGFIDSATAVRQLPGPVSTPAAMAATPPWDVAANRPGSPAGAESSGGSTGDAHATSTAPSVAAPRSPKNRADAAALAVDWRQMLLMVWAAGTLLVLASAVTRAVRFRRALAHGRPAPHDLQRRAAALGRRLGLRRAPRVWQVSGRVSPMLWALGPRARLILPAHLVDRLDAAETDSLLAHELAHLRRRDHWVRWLELAATALFWWLPPVWLIRRALRSAEEQCCDAWVVWSLPERAEAYARALVKTLDYLAGTRPAMPPAASGARHLRHLERRLTMIMDRTPPRMLGVAGRLGVAVMAVLMLSFLPTFAQDRKQDEIRALKHKLERVEMAIEQLHDAGMGEEVLRLKRVHHELSRRLALAQRGKASPSEPAHGRTDAVRRIDQLKAKAVELERAGRHDQARRAMLELQRLVKAMHEFEAGFELKMAESEMRIDRLQAVLADLEKQREAYGHESVEAREVAAKIQAVRAELEASKRALEQWVITMRNKVHGDLREHTAGQEKARRGSDLRGLQRRLDELGMKAHQIAEKLHEAESIGRTDAANELRAQMARLRAHMAEVRVGIERARKQQAHREHAHRENAQEEEEIVEEVEPEWRTLRGKKGGHARLPHQPRQARTDKLEALLHRQQEQIAHQQAMIQKLQAVIDRTMQQQTMLADQVKQLQHELKKARGERDPSRNKRRM